MLERVLAMALCLSVSVSVGVLSKRLNESDWCLAWGLLSTCPTLCSKEIQVSPKIRVLSSGILSQTPNLDLALAYRSSKRVVDFARQDGRFVYNTITSRGSIGDSWYLHHVRQNYLVKCECGYEKCAIFNQCFDTSRKGYEIRSRFHNGILIGGRYIIMWCIEWLHCRWPRVVSNINSSYLAFAHRRLYSRISSLVHETVVGRTAQLQHYRSLCVAVSVASLRFNL